MTEHAIGLNMEEGKAFIEDAYSHTVGVVNLKETVNRSERIRSEGIGTGTTCLWNGTKIILTAKHVLDGAGPNDVAFLPRVGSSLSWDSPGKMTGMSERVAIGIERIIRCPWEDLAAILVLRPDRLERLNTQFCLLPKRLAADSTVQGQGGVLLIGFPVNQTFEVSESKGPGHVTKVMACPSEFFWGELVETPERPLSSRYDPDHHLLIRFEPPTHSSQPFGYSGAAVWCDPQRRGAIWTADPLLLGVEFCAYQDSRLMVAVRAGMVRRFLEESLG